MAVFRPSICLISLAFCLTASAEDWRNQVFPVQSHDFGSVAVASDTEFYFPVVNTFSSPMHIQDIRTSCGCTTPTAITSSINPGESGSIRAKFNTETFRGKKAATLTVVIDKPFYSEVRLRINGYIRSDIVFHPGKVDFGSINTGAISSETRVGGNSRDSDTAIRKVNQIMYAGRSDWEILDVKSNRKWMTPTFVETSRGDGRINYDLAVAISSDAPQGFFQDEVTLITNDRAMPRVPLKVTGRVESLLSVTPSSIAGGNIRKGEPMVKRVVLIAKRPVAVTAMTAEGWTIELPKETTSKKSHILQPTFTYIGQATGEMSVPITVSTDQDAVSTQFTLVATVQ